LGDHLPGSWVGTGTSRPAELFVYTDKDLGFVDVQHLIDVQTVCLNHADQTMHFSTTVTCLALTCLAVTCLAVTCLAVTCLA
jgi:hypothetical protein